MINKEAEWAREREAMRVEIEYIKSVVRAREDEIKMIQGGRVGGVLKKRGKEEVEEGGTRKRVRFS